MTDALPPCPACAGEYTYEIGSLYVCPSCGYEWAVAEPADDETDPTVRVVKDAVGNVLADGDTVVITTSIKVKGSPQGIKAGTKVRGIRLVDPVNGHDIDCKIDGFGAMMLKSSVVKRV